MFKNVRILLIAAILVLSVCACKKESGQSAPPNPPPPPPGNNSLSYGDSVFFISNQSSDYIITPVNQASGTYLGFPEGISIDQSSGAINVSKSETGLKYRIYFIATGTTDTITTTLTISGINFLDGFYKLTTSDSIAHPLYNANAKNAIPGLNNGSVFDEGSNCNSAGCTVDIVNGQINLAQTVRNGVFGTTPSNNDRHEFDLNYRINDKSGEALNTIRVKLYYFDTMNDVTQECYDIISSREGTIIDATNQIIIAGFPIKTNSTTVVNGSGFKAAKPRPPCIFIVSH
ncbi:MAG: hypothetical protein JST75_21055 [Bacteroidetes bacterium]|nr:hypothetical protein [Bacteroidota bacterium]